MGGAYFCRRDWFLKLGALKYLRGWGCDEGMLAVKSYRAGGDVRLISAFGIGHKFPQVVIRPNGKILEVERKPYSIGLGLPTLNKLFAILTLVPEPLATRLVALVDSHCSSRAESKAAFDMLARDYHIILAEQQYNAQLFTTSFEEYCERFGINTAI
jgi:hypothetical protein